MGNGITSPATNNNNNNENDEDIYYNDDIAAIIEEHQRHRRQRGVAEPPRHNGSFLSRWVGELATMAIAVPLKFLYHRGPSLGGYGFWESLPSEEICSRLTNVDARFWTSSEDAEQACDGLIERKFEAFMIGSLALAFALGFTVVIVQVACRCIIVRPIVNAIKTNQRRRRHRQEEDDDDDDDDEEE